MATSGILQREPIRIPDTVEQFLDEARSDLADRAEKTLGYLALKKAVDKTQAAKHAKMVRLAECFGELDIQPFTNESVEAYKKAKLESVRRKDAAHRLGIGASATIAVLGFLALLLGAILTNFENVSGGVFSFFVFSALTLMGGMLSLGAALDQTYLWHRVPINQYVPHVPKQALEMAIAIKQALPNAIIEIDALTQNRDPFLAANIEGEQFYIAVWDEPDFGFEVK